jgi:hypothetical protein
MSRTATINDGVKGNPNLKPRNIMQEFNAEQIAEYQKCMEDPLYFIQKYVYVKDSDFEDLVALNLYPFQKNIIENMENHRFNIVKAARQVR